MTAANPPADDLPQSYALAYAAAGIRVLPIRPGGKHPPMKSWQHAATVDPATIANWWNGLYRDHGVGLAMGTQPDGRHLFAIDLDRHNPEADGLDTWAEMVRAHDYAIADAPTAITGAGGVHLLYASPYPVTNGASRHLGPGIDVRGQGGQIVVAPSIHPNGHAYDWEDGYAPWEIDIAPAPAWLLELMAPGHEAPSNDTAPASEEAGAGHRASLPSPYQDSPADLLRDGFDWPTELSLRGWQVARVEGSDIHYTRPGKDPRQGSSGVLHPGGPFVVFTTDASVDAMWRAGTISPDGTCVSLSPLALVAAYDHGGDLQAAGRALRAQTPPMDLRALIAAQSGPETPTAPSGADTPAEGGEEWDPIDVATIAAEIVAGTRERQVPELLEVDGALPLLYRGRLHSIFGPPAGGKTWIALAALAERLRLEEHALFVDWEDNADGTVGRLLDLGVTVDEIARLDYINPSTALALGIVNLHRLSHSRPWHLVVIDSAGEAMAAAGIDPNADGQVATWMALAKTLCAIASKPAVVMLDHVPKPQNGNDTPAGYAIGSQRKLAAISGAAYRCDTLVEPAIGKAGKIKMVVAKDRLGNRAKGSTAAEVHFDPKGETMLGLRFNQSDAQAAAERGERFRPTHLMDRVSRWLELNPGSNVNTIVGSVAGKRTSLLEAIDILHEEGHLSSINGARNSRCYTVEKPYREDFDTLIPPTGSPVPDQFPPVPGNRVTTGSSGSPPPLGGIPVDREPLNPSGAPRPVPEGTDRDDSPEREPIV